MFCISLFVLILQCSPTCRGLYILAIFCSDILCHQYLVLNEIYGHPYFFSCIFSCVPQVTVQPDVSSSLYVVSTVIDLSSTCISYFLKINFNVIHPFPSSALEMAVFRKVLPQKVCTFFFPASYVHAQHNHHLHN